MKEAKKKWMHSFIVPMCGGGEMFREIEGKEKK